MPEPTPTRDDLPPVTGEALEDVLSPIIADVLERTGPSRQKLKYSGVSPSPGMMGRWAVLSPAWFTRRPWWRVTGWS